MDYESEIYYEVKGLSGYLMFIFKVVSISSVQTMLIEEKLLSLSQW